MPVGVLNKGERYGDLGRRCFAGGRVAFVVRLIALLGLLWVSLAVWADDLVDGQVHAPVSQPWQGAVPWGPTATGMGAAQTCNGLAGLYSAARTDGQVTYTGAVESDGATCKITWCGVSSGTCGVQSELGMAPFGGPQPDCSSNPGSTPGAGSFCTCPTGHSDSTRNFCTPGKDGQPQKTDDQCKAQFGQQSGDGSTKFDWHGGSVGCYQGCVATPENMYGSGSNQWATGPWTTVGGSCNGTGAGGDGTQPPGKEPTPPGMDVDPAATQCSAPTDCAGQVNGVTVCVPCGSQTGQKTTTTTSDDGSGTKTPGDVVTKGTTTNPDGTITKTTTTYHPDGTSTTTVTTGPADTFGGGGAGTTPDPASSFCKQNPDSPMCKKSSFGGTCSATFSCDGDAVQCAIAQEQHQRDCAFYDPASQGGDLGTQSGIGTHAASDGDHPSWSPADLTQRDGVTVDMATSLDTQNDPGSACLADQVVTVGGTPVTFPWSAMCSSMQLVGKFVYVLGMFVSALILFRPRGGGAS